MFMYTGGENTSSYRATLFLFQEGKSMLIEVTDAYISQELGRYEDDRLNKLVAAMDKRTTSFLAGKHPNNGSKVFADFIDGWPPPGLVSEATMDGLKVVPVSRMFDWVREARIAAG